MYEQFYKFIARLIIDYLKEKDVKPGQKLEFKLSSKEEVMAFNKVIAKEAESQPFTYPTPQSIYETTCLNIGGVKMIIASDVNNVNPSFLASLRNLVGTDHALFKDTAVLFVHNSSLDTLISGADKLQKESMPLHYKNIDKHLKIRLKKGNISTEIKAIVEFMLSKQSKFTLDSSRYLAEYREIIQVLAQGTMNPKEYEAFGLFYDSTLKDMPEKEIKIRLEENAKYYAMAHTYHELNTEDKAIQKDFDERGIRYITANDWKTLDYKTLGASLDRQRKSVTIEYIEEEKLCTVDGLIYWEKPASTTAAGSRTRHIIIFNPSEKEECRIEFKFSQKLKKAQCQMVNGSQAEISVRGEQLSVTLLNNQGELSYSRIKYKDKKNYEFRILVVPLEVEYFNDFKTSYMLPTKIKEKGILLEREEASFKLGANSSKTELLALASFQTSLEIDPLNQNYVIEAGIENPEGFPFEVALKINTVILPIQLKGEVIKPKPITGVKVDQLKREKGLDFTDLYNEETCSFKLFIGTEHYFAQDELLKQLRLERNMIKQPACAYEIKKDVIQPVELALDEKLRGCYFDLIRYYEDNQLLPSLAYMTVTLQTLMQEYLNAYTEVLRGITVGISLATSEKNLLRLGQVEILEQDKIMWSPLHPLNIAYSLQKHEVLQKEHVAEGLLKRLVATHLVSYIKGDAQKIYTSTDEATGNWIYFERLKKEHISSNKDLNKIVTKTINSFKDNFKYLLYTQSYPIKINVIHVDGKEVIGGILKYLHEDHKNEFENITPIELNYYKMAEGRSVFYEIGHDDELFEEILEKYLPSVKAVDYGIYIKLFRRCITIYQLEGDYYKEAHISFVGTSVQPEVTYRNTMEVSSSLMLEGIGGSFTTYTEEEHYVQLLGLGGIRMNPLLEVVRGLNAIAQIGNSGNPYEADVAIALAMPQDHLESYEEVETCSDWTVYIEPKIECKYFTNKKDCMIHYVDRFYSADVIDAITLSKKVDIYTQTMYQKISDLYICVEKDQLTSYVDSANILNGEWLVSLLGFKKNTDLESIHIVALIKWVKQYFDPTYQYWVPISIHEFLRICEGTGAYASIGLFSSKNYERYINDLLWIGYRIDGVEVDIALYPMSVSADKPGDKLFKLIESVVTGDSFEDKYFRQLLLQKGMINGELLGEKGFFELPFEIEDEIRDKLINGQYQMALDYNDIQGYEANVVFNDGYKSGIERAGKQLLIKTNIESIWLETLDLQKIQVAPLPKIQVGSLDEVPVTDEPVEPIDPVEIEELAELDLPVEARYSIVYYMEEISPEARAILDRYLKRGIKGYILVNGTQEEFKSAAGTRYEDYQYLEKQQMLTFLYDIRLSADIEEPYIADGKIEDDGFYKEITETAFNRDQYEVEHARLENNMMVRAGAGTGKTKVMIDRIMFIKHMQPATKLDDIVMITFTNESTMEMRLRLSNRLAAYYKMTQDKMYLDWMDELASMQISTIHAFAKNMIGLLGEEIGMTEFNISGYKREKKRQIEIAIDEFSMLYPGEFNEFRYMKQYELTKMIMEMSDNLDNRGISLTSDRHKVDFGEATSTINTQHFFSYVLRKVAAALDGIKSDNGSYETNDLIKKLRDLKRVQELKTNCRIAYLMVDEFQDTDEVQVDFIAWLTNELQNNLFIVGDTKQSIYRFRGADYNAFKQLSHRIDAQIHVKKLAKNYRSDKVLVTQLNELFSKSDAHVEKFSFDQEDLLVGTKEISGASVFQNPKLENQEEIPQQARDIYLQHKDKGNVCALVRTNKEVRKLTRGLERLKVPVIAKIKGSYYKNEAIRDFYLLVRVLLHPERLGEWMMLEESHYGQARWKPENVLMVYSPNKQHLLEFLRDSLWYKDLLLSSEACKSAFVLHVLKDIIKKHTPHIEYARRYYAAMKNEHNDEDDLKAIARHKGKEYEANLNKLFYILQSNFTDQQLSLHQIEEFLNMKISTDREEHEMIIEEAEPIQALQVMTVHQSKGLEFDTVIIPYTTQFFDTKKKNECVVAYSDEDYKVGYKLEGGGKKFENTYYGELYKEERLEKAGEETRLFYVACTRAKASLYILTNLFASTHNKVGSWQDLIVRR